jgi:hypothetical protein
MVVMAAAVRVAVGMVGRDRRSMRMSVPCILDGVQSPVAEKRNAAVNGEQAPADQVVDTEIHRSQVPAAKLNMPFARHVDSVRCIRS